MKKDNLKPLVLVILGPPGSGKGTQSKVIVDKYNLNYVATGNLIRELRVLDTPLGRKVKINYDKGIPQPDDIVIEAVKHKLSTFDLSKGVLFDTFPLSIGQADALENITKELELHAPTVIYLEIKPATVMKRVSGRLICSGCGLIYLPDDSNAYVNQRCAKCGEKLTQRADDKPDVVLRRIKEYDGRMKDLKEYYRAKNRLIMIDGEPPIAEVSQTIFNKISEIQRSI